MSPEVAAMIGALQKEREQLASERDRYKAAYLSVLELCKKLERGIVGQKRERYVSADQLTLSLVGMLVGQGGAPQAPAGTPSPPTTPAAATTEVQSYKRPKPTGRKPLPETLPRVDVEILPDEVQKAGLDAFERIGEDVVETVERRPASLVVVRIHKPKFALKGRDRLAETKILQAAPAELPIERGLAGPGLLADTVVRRFQDHLPLNRLERIYGREGLELPRSTVCGWHADLADLLKPLIDAMWQDALAAPYLCTDATGVLVQDRDKCHGGHFWVVAAPEKHVLFNYTRKHDKAAVDERLKNYKGYLVADAHAVYDHLYQTGKVVEVGCWAHARRYFFKTLETDRERAGQALAHIKALFDLERTHATSPPEPRLAARRQHAKPLVDAFFAWCEQELPRSLEETPLQKALRYALNQRQALCRFLDDGRLPLHNNFSERQLRREAIGRKNWLFLGSDDAGDINSTFVSLLASCQLHNIEPWAYLRDLFCLLPSWPAKRVLDLAPAFWLKTIADPAVQSRLDANLYRRATLSS